MEESGLGSNEVDRLFAVVAEAFAMVSAQDNHRVLIDAFVFQKVEKASYLLVGEGNFTVIGMG